MGTHDITDEKAEKSFLKEISGFQTEWKFEDIENKLCLFVA